MTLPSAGAALVAATALHLGFQLVVTVLVYPALARVPADRWPVEHIQHSRRVTPVVGVVYGLLLVAGASVLVARPSGAQVASLVAVGAAMLVTATVAAPVHSRLGGPAVPAATSPAPPDVASAPLAPSGSAREQAGAMSGPEPTLLRRLLLADRVRLVLALVAALLALAGS